MLRRVRGFFRMLGPGLITGAADNDPGSIGTFAVSSASLGYAILWVGWFLLPLKIVIQYVSAKIGQVTGSGLAANFKIRFPRWVLFPAILGLMFVNTFNAGANIGAIAAGINLLAPIPIVAMILPIALLILAIEIWGSYRLIERIFKWLTLVLFAYIGSAFFSRPDFGEVLRGTLIPKIGLDTHFLVIIVAILGTSISPYLYFWEPSQEVEEEIAMGEKTVAARRGATDKELRDQRLDTATGMSFSQTIVYFIILATSATLFKAGNTDIGSAAEAAEAMRPLAGSGATILMAIGLIGSGMLSVPVLTGSASYALAETMGWEYGFGEKARRAKHFYIAIAVSTMAGLMVNFLGINPIRALFLTAIFNGLLAPLPLVMIMTIANDKKMMGRRRNNWVSNIGGWFTTAVMIAAIAALIYSWLIS